MKYDCLIVDDEKVLADSTTEYFNLFGIKTYACYDKKSCLDFLELNKADIILLDINLADGSGFELCKELRIKTDVPILFISARNKDDDKIIALNIGGDDYIEKPYSLGVLLAKVKVVLKRYNKTNSINYDDGNLFVDLSNNYAKLRNKEIKLTSLEYKLLKYLITNTGKLISKNELFEQVWNDKLTQDNTLNVHIRKLRELIEEDPNNPKYIVTVWKEGYKFISRV